jgi:replication factor C small subunit
MVELNQIWIEKYRPQRFEDVVGNWDIIQKLSNIQNLNDMPHLLFEGMSGVGKTTVAYIIANKFFGQNVKLNLLELNASDERGIDIVRDKIKGFAKTVGLSTDKKIIFLDEFDSMTADAQNALRRIMELYVNNCVFILSCNYINKIIEPIKSRCYICSFKPIKKEDILKRTSFIIEQEKINIIPEALDILVKISGGDMRRIINDLQSLFFLKRKITEEDVEKQGIDFNKIFNNLNKNEFKYKREYIQSLLDTGIEIRRLLSMMRDWVFTNLQNGEILYELMMADYRIIEGVDVNLVIDGFLWRCLK